jgi:hypothetical protein
MACPELTEEWQEAAVVFLPSGKLDGQRTHGNELLPLFFSKRIYTLKVV